MRVLAIDPGYERLGVAIIDKPEKAPSKEELIYSDCFKTSAKLDFTKRLLLIGEEVERLIVEFSPEGLSIENLFMSTNQKTAMHVSEVRGMILYIAIKNGLRICELTPLQIKSAVTGNGKSDKAQMIKMIGLILGIQNAKEGSKVSALKNKKLVDDEYDAIAAGLAYFALRKHK